jgi:hypothetical protein
MPTVLGSKPMKSFDETNVQIVVFLFYKHYYKSGVQFTNLNHYVL